MRNKPHCQYQQTTAYRRLNNSIDYVVAAMLGTNDVGNRLSLRDHYQVSDEQFLVAFIISPSPEFLGFPLSIRMV